MAFDKKAYDKEYNKKNEDNNSKVEITFNENRLQIMLLIIKNNVIYIIGEVLK